jgi:hypothetical protein
MDFYYLCLPPNIICVIKMGRIRWAGYVARMGDSRGSYRALERTSERNRQLGRLRLRWEGNIKINIQQVE